MIAWRWKLLIHLAKWTQKGHLQSDASSNIGVPLLMDYDQNKMYNFFLIALPKHLSLWLHLAWITLVYAVRIFLHTYDLLLP